MTERIKGNPHGLMGWRVDRVEFINGTVYELCDNASGWFSCNSIDELEAYANMWRDNEALNRAAGAVHTADELAQIVAALDEAVRDERTRRGLNTLREAERHNAQSIEAWREAHGG